MDTANQCLLFAVGDQRPIAFGDEFGETKVENLGVAVAAEHQVLGFKIAMNDAELVCASQARRDLDRDLDRFFQLQTACFDLLPQRFAFDEFHRDVRLAVVFADFIDRQNVWMGQCRRSACFLKETAAAVLLRHVFRRQHFQRDDALQFVVVSFVDRAHATGADGLDDAVMSDGLDGNGLHGESEKRIAKPRLC